MIRFKEFLGEQWKKGIILPDGLTGYKKSKIVHVSEPVKHRNLRVIFTRRHLPGKKPDHANVDFSVNGSFHRPGTMEQGHAILHQVHKAISQYVRQRKPKSISMSGNDIDKHDMYKRYAEHLAKKHGGRVSHIEDEYGHSPDVVTVHFNHGTKK